MCINRKETRPEDESKERVMVLEVEGSGSQHDPDAIGYM